MRVTEIHNFMRVSVDAMMRRQVHVHARESKIAEKENCSSYQEKSREKIVCRLMIQRKVEKVCHCGPRQWLGQVYSETLAKGELTTSTGRE